MKIKRCDLYSIMVSIAENQQQIEMAIKSRSSSNRRQARNTQMRNAVQEFAETSAVLLQER